MGLLPWTGNWLTPMYFVWKRVKAQPTQTSSSWRASTLLASILFLTSRHVPWKLHRSSNTFYHFNKDVLALLVMVIFFFFLRIAKFHESQSLSGTFEIQYTWTAFKVTRSIFPTITGGSRLSVPRPRSSFSCCGGEAIQSGAIQTGRLLSRFFNYLFHWTPWSVSMAGLVGLVGTRREFSCAPPEKNVRMDFVAK
jgi:hypothetical protein